MRLSLIARGVAATAAALLLTGCGGSSDDDATPTPSSEASSSAAETSSEAPESDSEFCTEAAAIPENLEGSFADANDPDSLTDGLQSAAEEIRGIEPPDEIADDWNALGDGLEQAASSLEGLDLSNPEAAAQLQAELGQLQEELETSGTNVETYLREECGIDTEGTGTSSDTAAPSS